MENETENTLPATGEDVQTRREEQPLEIRADAVPERRFASESIRAPLPPAVYERLGQMILTPEQEAILNEPVDPAEVDIRPDDGAVYLSHAYYRKQLTRAFGRMGWSFIPGSPLAQEPGTKNYYRVWILFVGGVYAAEAMASRQYHADNARMDLSDVAEAIKSDCIRRVCKDMQIGMDCWDKRWTEKWKRENAIQVIAKDWKGNNSKMWRRKDADPLPGEVTSQARGPQQPAPQQQPQSSPPSQAAPAPAPPKPAPAPRPVQVVPDAPKAAPVAPAPTQAAPKPSTAPKLLDSQIRLIFARGRNAGLVVGEDASPLIEYLATNYGVPEVQSDGKKSTELCHAQLKSLPPSKVTELCKKLDELAKGQRADEGQPVESI